MTDLTQDQLTLLQLRLLETPARLGGGTPRAVPALVATVARWLAEEVAPLRFCVWLEALAVGPADAHGEPAVLMVASATGSGAADPPWRPAMFEEVSEARERLWREMGDRSERPLAGGPDAEPMAYKAVVSERGAWLAVAPKDLLDRSPCATTGARSGLRWLVAIEDSGWQRDSFAAPLASALWAALRLVQVVVQREEAGARFEERYSRQAFVRNASRVAEVLEEMLLLDPVGARHLLRRFALQYHSWVLETFGEHADPRLVNRLLQEARRVPAATHGKDGTPPQRNIDSPPAEADAKREGTVAPCRTEGTERDARPEEPDSETRRAATLWGDLVHIAALLREDSQAPLGLGRLLGTGRHWEELLVGLMAVHAAGALEAVLLLRDHESLYSRLSSLGWVASSGRAAELLTGLCEAACREYSPEARHVWLTPAKQAPTRCDGVADLEGIAARWLRLHAELDLRLRQPEDVLRINGKGRSPLEVLWCETDQAAWTWLFLHKQWSFPGGVDAAKGEWVRRSICDQAGLGEEPPYRRDGSFSFGDTGLPIPLHIDSLWTSLYLLTSVLHALEPGEQHADHWAGLRERLPDPVSQHKLLLHLAAYSAYVLWTLARFEEAPERFCFQAPDSAADFSSQDSGSKVPAYRVYHHPIGKDRFRHALVHMLEVFGHHVLGVEAEIDVAGHLLGRASADAGLRAFNEYRRDHIFHTLDVCMIGDFLLASRVDTNHDELWRTLFRKVAGNGDGGPVPEAIRRSWFVAAVFHDVGHTLSLLGALPTLLSSEASNSYRDLATELEVWMRGGRARLAPEVAAALDRPSLDEKHVFDRGVVSSVALRDTLARAGTGGSSSALVQTYADAIRAIALRTLGSEPIHQSRDPLALLLVLCEELCDWGWRRVCTAELRELMLFGREVEANWQERSVPVLVESILGVSALAGRSVSLTLAGAPGADHGQPTSRRKPASLVVVQSYHPDESGHLNAMHLWVVRAANLQRLHLETSDEVDLEIRLVTRTPRPHLHRRLSTSFEKALQAVCTTAPHLHLQRLVKHLARERQQLGKLARQLGVARGGQAAAEDQATAMTAAGREANHKKAEEALCCFWYGFLDAPEADAVVPQGGTPVEVQLMTINALAKEAPLSGYPQEQGIAPLSEEYRRFLDGEEMQRSRQGRRFLESGQARRHLDREATTEICFTATNRVSE